MCTLSYIPTRDGFIFTHNRDERKDRPTSKDLLSKEINGKLIHYPKDLEAQGTWIAVSDSGRSICLLNGGNKVYKRKDSYRQSRGLVVLDNFQFDRQEHFVKDYELQDIEAFTMLIRDHTGLWKLVHDEEETTLEELDPEQSGIWSSTTLYSPSVREKRALWFLEWQKQGLSDDPVEVRSFHMNAGDGDRANDLIMNRHDFLQTLSITQIHKQAEILNIRYEDLLQSSRDERSLPIRA